MIYYTIRQLSFLRRRRRLPRAELTRIFNRHYDTDYTVSQIHSLFNRRGWRTGRDGRFKRGHIAWNNGTKGICKPNSGSFKKGNVPVNFKPVGSERIDADGYVWTKTADPNIWRQKNRLVWEKVNGPVPQGHVLRFKDGNKLNCKIENMELMSRNLHARLNQLHYNAASKKHKPTIMLLAQIRSKYSRAYKEAI